METSQDRPVTPSLRYCFVTLLSDTANTPLYSKTDRQRIYDLLRMILDSRDDFTFNFSRITRQKPAERTERSVPFCYRRWHLPWQHRAWQGYGIKCRRDETLMFFPWQILSAWLHALRVLLVENFERSASRCPSKLEKRRLIQAGNRSRSCPMSIFFRPRPAPSRLSQPRAFISLLTGRKGIFQLVSQTHRLLARANVTDLTQSVGLWKMSSLDRVIIALYRGEASGPDSV